MDDEHLMRAIAEGDEQAFVALYSRYRVMVASIIRRQHLPDVEAVVQDVFLKLWKTAGRFDHRRASLTKWVAMHANGEAIDQVRRLVNRRPKDGAVVGLSHAMQLASPSRADTSVGRMEEVEKVMAAVSPAQHDTMLMVARGLTCEQIAAAEGVAVGTVKSRIHYVKKFVKFKMPREQ